MCFSENHRIFPLPLKLVAFTYSAPAGSFNAESRTQPLRPSRLAATGAAKEDAGVANGVIAKTWRSLSIDHDLSRDRKLCPNSSDPAAGTTEATTSRSVRPPTVKERMRKRC